MSRIDELIAEHCPTGVERRAIGDVCKLVRGNGMPKSEFTETGVGCIHYGQIYTHYGTWATETISYVATESAASLAKVDPGDIVATNTSENLEDLCKAVAWLGVEQIVTGGHATVLKHDEDPKYIAYCLQTPDVAAQVRKLATGTKVMDISTNKLARVRIPLPPLAVQRAIVEVLDRFAAREMELAAELAAELEGRERQYVHYKNALLSFVDAEVDWVPLANLGEIIRGRRFTKSDYVDDGLGAIHYADMYTHFGASASVALHQIKRELAPNMRFARPGDVVIAEVGETVVDVGKAVAWIGTEDVAVHDGCFVLRHSLNPVYVSYCLQTAAYRAEKAKHVVRAKLKRLRLDGLEKIRIPVPTRAEQDHIVGILESFDDLLRKLLASIPAETTARRVQYEYYRDRLLTFDEVAA